MDFPFFAHRFFKENLWNFFSQMPDALGICGTMYKVKIEENLFLWKIWLPSQNARTRVRLLYIFLKWCRFISPVRYPGYQFSSPIFSRSNRQFTFKILISSPDPPNNYFLLHFWAIISPKNLKFTHFWVKIWKNVLMYQFSSPFLPKCSGFIRIIEEYIPLPIIKLIF